MRDRLSPTGLPKIYYLYPTLAGPAWSWPGHFARARAMGFDVIGVPPLFRHAANDPFLATDHERAPDGRMVEEVAAGLCAECQAAGMRLLVDIVLDRVDPAAPVASGFPGRYQPSRAIGRLDPRAPAADGWVASLADKRAIDAFAEWWVERMAGLARRGVAGFRLLGLDALPSQAVTAIVRGVPDVAHLAWTPGMDWRRIEALADAGLDGVFASAPWWDGRAGWFVRELETLRRVAPVVVPVEAPFGERVATRADTAGSRAMLAKRALRIAAVTGDALLMPMGFDRLATRRVDAYAVPDDLAGGGATLAAEVREANDALARAPRGAVLGLTGPGAAVSMIARVDCPDPRRARVGVALAINTDSTRPRRLESAIAVGGLVGLVAHPVIPAGEARMIALERKCPVIRSDAGGEAIAAAAAPRIVVENVSPRVAGGPFAAKRIVGRPVEIEADIYADGHDMLAAEALWRSADETQWRRVPMEHVGNDRWRASFTPLRLGRHEIVVEAWWDEFGSQRHAIETRHEAGVDIDVDLAEARAYLRGLADRGPREMASKFLKTVAALEAASGAAQVKAILSPEMRALVAAADPRAFAARCESSTLDAERPEAAFASWYELFPRSMTTDENRHGTFADVIAALPRIRDMGFDVLYFPPIHPIGTTNRKGRNNAVGAAPGDVGSPYATGSEAGGHDAIHPELGTPEDFRRLVAAAREEGLEIALDFAIQCSPDHPWLRDHPQWFKRRVDGTIKYAENPPKKYQDIHNVDFYAAGAVPSLWLALRDIVLHWVAEGVTIFRVDNPHTKPLPFWQWMIDDVRGRHPEVIFLSEAFTRPKVMYRLAKVGFSQSYTYFTWRDTKHELTEYLTELSTSEVKDFFRPHFFVNTPDINPYFLQRSGRAGFLIRAALACTMSGLWGMYCGFEIAEAAPLPGREEYLDSEKYQIRVRDFAAPGNIVREITTLNRLRRAHPALQSHLGIRFYNAFNDRIIYYGKHTSPLEDMILVAVNLDPHAAQEATFEIPLWEWNLPDSGSLEVEDLMSGHRFTWTGKIQRMRLDPATLPFAVWRVAPAGGAAA